MGIKYTQDSLAAAAMNTFGNVTYDAAIIVALGVVVLLVRFLWSNRKSRK